MRTLQAALLLGATALFVACSDDPEDLPDSGVNPVDTGARDTGIVGMDVPPVDTGVDAGRGDMGPADSGDTGVMDIGPRSIVFLHTNDEHSHQLGFAPEIDDFPTPAAPGTGIVGGVRRRAKVIADLRAEAARAPIMSPVALVSSGDQMMGSLFHLANPSRGIDYALMALLGYDVMTLGNHEFDFGVGALAGALENGGLGAGGAPGVVNIPIVASNIRFSMGPGDDTLEQYYSVNGGANRPLRRTHIKRIGNVTVGFLGLLGLDAALVAPFKTPVRFSLAQSNMNCTSDDDCPGSVCLPPANNPIANSGRCAVNTDETDFATHLPQLIGDAAAAVADLRAQNVDIVVALSHVGVNERELAMLEAMGMGPEEAQVSEEILVARGVDQALAALNVPGIDVIIGGHSHTALQEPLVIPNTRGGINTYIVQAGSYGRFVGKLRLTQSRPGTNWELDTAYSGLEPVDDTVDLNGLDPFTDMLISGAIAQVISGLEGQRIAQPGDNLIFPGEECDGTEFPNNGLCAGLIPGATGGTLTCHTNNLLSFAQCTFPGTCGNGVVEPGEQCDGNNLNGVTCLTLGHTGGAISCGPTCGVNTSQCTPYYPSLLEVVVNFGNEGAPIRNDPQVIGDLFFYTFGTTSFDIPDAPSSNEGNLINLITDAERWSANTLVPRLQNDPIRVNFNANGVLRDGIYEGRTGNLSTSDLFRVLPLGVSPVETTPGFTLVDFYLLPSEILAGLEIGVGTGVVADSFWLGVSGMRVNYDLSRPVFDPANPVATGRVMLATLTSTGARPWDDSAATLETTPLIDRTLPTLFPDPTRLVHVSTSLYIALLMESLGICPRLANGDPMPHCRPCMMQSQCTIPDSICSGGRCQGGVPAAFSRRTLVPPNFQELKEFLALTTYIRSLRDVPTVYSTDVPRRMCCVGTACPADGSRTCD